MPALDKLKKYFHPEQLLSAYEQYKIEDKKKDNSSSSSQITEVESEEEESESSVRSSLETKLKGTYYIITGYLDNPEVDDYGENESTGELVLITHTNLDGEEIPARKLENEKGFRNQFGLVDYFTLFIPYHIEAFCRGNWISHPTTREQWKFFFTYTIFVIPLASSARTLVGLALMIPASIVTTITHLVEPYYDRWQVKKEYELAYEQYNDVYTRLKNLFKDNVVTAEINGKRKIALNEHNAITLKDGLTEQDKQEILETSSSYIKELQDLMPKMQKLTEVQPQATVDLPEQSEKGLKSEPVEPIVALDAKAKRKLNLRMWNAYAGPNNKNEPYEGKYSTPSFKRTFS